MSSFFSHPFYTEEASFTPLFRLLDDFDAYSRQGVPRHGRRTHLRTFTPKFDMRETENSFELHGELPGIDKEHISIDFTDPQTIVIKGKIERSYEAGTPPAGFVTGPAMSGAITEAGEETASNNSHKATVADAGEDGEELSQQEVVKKDEAKVAKEKTKYWYSERSIGEFSRTFGFPCLVDQESVTASLKNGILNISIPKAKKPTSRRVAIQ